MHSYAPASNALRETRAVGNIKIANIKTKETMTQNTYVEIKQGECLW